MSGSWRPHELQPSRLLRPWDFPGKSTGVGCHCLLQTLGLPLRFLVIPPRKAEGWIQGRPLLERFSFFSRLPLGESPGFQLMIKPYPSCTRPFFSLTASLAQHHLLMALYDQPLDTVLRGLETRYLFFPPWNFLSEAEKETQ